MGAVRIAGWVIAAVLLSAATSSAGHATSVIGVSFTAGRYRPDPADQPGVVPGKNWSSGVGASGTMAQLLDDSGKDTGAAVSWTAAAASDDFGIPTTSVSATNLLYAGGLVGMAPGGEVRVTVTGVPYKQYSVYAYVSQDSAATSELSVDIGSTTYYFRGAGADNKGAPMLTHTTSTDAAAPTAGPAQYQVFSGLTDPSFTLHTAGSADGLVASNVFAVQIVGEQEGIAAGLTLVRGLTIVISLAAAGVLFWRAMRAPSRVARLY